MPREIANEMRQKPHLSQSVTDEAECGCPMDFSCLESQNQRFDDENDILSNSKVGYQVLRGRLCVSVNL